jgi:hypothetical protein
MKKCMKNNSDHMNNVKGMYYTNSKVQVRFFNLFFRDASHNDPGYWSRACLQNMAKLAKEASTVRHVLEPLFKYFDSSDCWSPESNIATSVLSEMQLFMDSPGQC